MSNRPVDGIGSKPELPEIDLSPVDLSIGGPLESVEKKEIIREKAILKATVPARRATPASTATAAVPDLAARSKLLRTPLAVVLALSTIVFIVQFGNSLSDVPSTRLLEDIICHEYYGNYSRSLIDEIQCQGPEVQAELNFVIMGSAIANFTPGIFLALVYGALADRLGRKPVWGLCLIGLIFSNLVFIAVAWTWQSGSIRLVWTSAIPLLIGGGTSVAEAVVLSWISDLSNELNRAMHFQVVIASVYIAQALAPIASEAIMAHDLWLPIFMSPCIMTFGALFTFIIPETIHLNPADSKIATIKTRKGKLPIKAKLRATTASLRETASLFRPAPLLLLITPAAALTIPVVMVAVNLALRSIPLRYGWTLGEAGVLLGARTGLSVVVLLAGVPGASLLLRRLLARGGTATPAQARLADLRLAQVSAAFVLLGLVVFAASPTIAAAMAGLVILTLGSGVPSLCRAVMAALVSADAVGRLFTALAMLEMVGFLVCAFGLGAVFQGAIGLAGNENGPAVLGLPSYVAAGVSLLTAAALWAVRIAWVERVTEGSIGGEE